MASPNGSTIGATNFGYLNACSLADALAHMASCGVTVVELGLAAPHFDMRVATPADVAALRSDLARHALRCCSVNAAELNLISQNEAVAELALGQYTRLIELASELGAPRAVIVPGRQHPLRPTPPDIALERFGRHMDILLRVAERCGVEIALETVPFGFLQTAGELAAWVRQSGHAHLSMVVDCANVFMVEDPASAVAAAGTTMSICHVSDAWKARWAHTSIGAGEIDFAAISEALAGMAFRGVTIYELMDAHDPRPRLTSDLERLESFGWQRND